MTGPAVQSPGELEAELRDALAPRIQVIKPLGAGGMGMVFLGRDPALKRYVVVKVLLPELAHDPTARTRFAREAEAAAAVSHPNVVSVFEVGELPRSATAYFVMQHVDGLTLQEAFPPGAAVPDPQVRRVVGDVASALAAAHARGLIHRDIKPSNVMLERDSGRAVVLDFGISAALGARAGATAQRLTMQGTSLGTPEYMSPEQAAAEDVTEESDVYSLGVLAFELLTGRLPFAGTTPMALAAAHIKDAPPTVRSVRHDADPQLADLVDRCLRKDPRERPAAGDIARTLMVSSATAIEWPPPGLERLLGQGRTLVRLLVALALLGAIILLWLSYAVSSASPAWYRRAFGSLRPESAAVESLAPGAFAWFVAPVLSLGAFLLVVGALYAALSLAASLRWAHAGGYPWDVLLDVTMDAGPDTAHLLGGTGPYGLVDERKRRQLKRYRRWSALCQLGALAACIPSGVVFITGLLPEPDEPVALVSLGQLAALAALPLLGWLASRALRQPEASVRRRQARDRLPRLRRPPLRTELVSAWLGSARIAAPQLPHAVTQRIAALAPFLATLLVGAAVVAPIAVSTSSTTYAGWILGQTQGQSDALTLLRDVHRQSAAREWPRLDSLLTVSGHIPRTGASGRAAADTLMLLAIVAPSVRPLFAGDTTARAAVRRTYPHVPRSRADTSLWQGLPGRLTAAQRRALAADTGSPRLHLWRLFAGADSVAPLWMIRPDFGGWSGSIWGLTDDRGRTTYRATMLDLAQRNMAAAMLALDRGDVATALLRTRENLAAAHHLYRQPLFGMRDLVEIGVVSLREVARVRGDSALRTQAAALTAALPPSRWYWLADEALLADPLDPPGFQIIADSLAHPELRWRLISAVAWAACANPREVAFGVSPRRLAVLDRALEAAHDIPRTDEWVAVQRRRLQRFADLRPLSRLRACTTYGGL